jgi:lipopolysaccharide export system protein LptA
MKNAAINNLILLALAVLPGTSTALSADKNEPMLIEADSAELDDKKGISIYKGNVKVTQGTLVLTGATMTVHNDGDAINKVIVTGSPATYKPRPDGKQDDDHAKAQLMEYYKSPETGIRTTEAVIEQGGDVLRSDRIVYDISNDQVTAGGGKPGQRVRITLQPKSKKE